jgi:hypothetical protein
VTADKVIISGGREEPVQGDGDIIGHLDATIELVPGGLQLVYPPGAPGAELADGKGYAAVEPSAKSDRIAAYTPPS